MFKSARTHMPVVDYVSIVRSVYKDRAGLLFGVFASMIASGTAAFKTDSVALWAISALFFVVGMLRYWDMRAFMNADIGPEDADAAEYWEGRVTIGGVAAALVYGSWCFVSLVVVDDNFSELISVSMTASALVGIVARNFGLDRLIGLQALFATGPVALGLFIGGDAYHWVLAALLVLLSASFRKLAGDVRAILLNAVHGRIEATRLAAELDTALAIMPHGLCMVDKNGIITVLNAQVVKTFFGGSRTDYVGRPFTDLIESGLQSGAFDRQAAQLLLDEVQDMRHEKLVLALADGRHCEATISSRQGFSVVMLEDITERVRAHERISFMARYDGLTKLANRSHFSDQVQAQLNELVARKGGEEVMMMIIDLDDFKHVNDTFGHPVGDMLLVEAAHRVNQVFGQDCLVARFGGDEFTIIVEDVGRAEDAAAIARKLLEALASPVPLASGDVVISASIGISLFPDDASSAADLTKAADTAMYRAKAGGRNIYRFYTSELTSHAQERFLLERDLRHALERDELIVHYQPQFDVASGRLVGVEALLRWQHPTRGLLSPGHFIEIAEESGLINPIGEWVLGESLADARRWQTAGLRLIRLAVNLSGRQLMSDRLIDRLRADPGQRRTGEAQIELQLEVTESVLLSGPAVVRRLEQLRQMGIDIAIDDFGTGYSSLSRLKHLPIDTLKVDRSFVQNLSEDEDNQAIVAAIVLMSHRLGLKVVAEGVETAEQLAYLAGLQCDEAQGYLFSKAVMAARIETMLREETLPALAHADPEA
ncbi:MAG: EAL domain-containing protein [Gammaproteobacteria bacterium]|nr:EAL domain-containing protein [Gammaproteobacteria bacterium]